MELNEIFRAVQSASFSLRMMEVDEVNRILMAVADEITKSMPGLLAANRLDLERMDPENPKYDRLRLSEARLLEIASNMRDVAALPSPLDITLEERTRPNGLHLRKVSVPFGVVGIIYEARPNVSFDVFSLCLKSGNACILKGGSDADCSNRAIVALIHGVLRNCGVDEHVVELLPSTREATSGLLHAEGYVDLIIPRGSGELIRYVRHEATVPVIETGAGICHAYFDGKGDLAKGAAIIHNAKTRRVSVCNALDCLLVHKDRLDDLPALCAPLKGSRVKIYADASAWEALDGNYPSELLEHAGGDSFGTEFLDYKMAVKTVDNVEAAVAHIHTYGSKHSECIITEDIQTAAYFQRAVDAACVYVNAPTSFTDGAQFGLGAEIGISTQKLHARGPMGLREMTTYKWLIEGNGQTRP
ncbi:MAG TPA: glutamate-5-semialdehyde dehydrogenase [Candidatus Phocaeicola excrementigallinarum]|nr:glutamate-5-semialdehyde dehydrogenase [Candidatus Phocaeicola excrementigallinarum]